MTARNTKARRALLDSATTLLAENPGASFIEIAEAAGVGRATLYRHFSTREDLIRALSLEAIEVTDAVSEEIMASAQTAFEALCKTMEAMIPLGDRYYFLTRLPEMDDEEIAPHLERQDRELTMLIEAAQKEGGIDPTLSASWATTVFNALIYAAWSTMKSDNVDRNELAWLTLRTFKDGLAPKAPTKSRPQVR